MGRYICTGFFFTGYFSVFGFPPKFLKGGRRNISRCYEGEMSNPLYLAVFPIRGTPIRHGGVRCKPLRSFVSTVFSKVRARWECDGVVHKWGVIKDRTTKFPLQRRKFFPKVGVDESRCRSGKGGNRKKLEKPCPVFQPKSVAQQAICALVESLK